MVERKSRPRVSIWCVLLACVPLFASTGCPSRPGCLTCTDPEPLELSCPYSSDVFRAPQDEQANVLLLSGGASHGAWGAGVIYGWEGRPDFHVVTGISTGALQAPLVFVDDDATLKKVYTTTKTKDVYRWKWFPLFSNSLQNRAPLEKMIHEYIDEKLIQKVATQSDRNLWIGTVNLDTSEFCSWDMVEIAQQTQQGTPEQQECYVQLFRDVIFAASGAPVVAPPVEIDALRCQNPDPSSVTPNGFLHVDGGTRLRVFAEQPFLDVFTQAKAAGSANIGPAKPNAYVIMNGKMQMHPTCVDDALLPIAQRAMDILMNEAVYGNLYFLKSQIGDMWELQLSYIADDYPLFKGSVFDPVEMTKLFDAGAEWIQQTPEPGDDSTYPWHGIPTKPVTSCPDGDKGCTCSV